MTGFKKICAVHIPLQTHRAWRPQKGTEEWVCGGFHISFAAVVDVACPFKTDILVTEPTSLKHHSAFSLLLAFAIFIDENFA